MTQMTILEHTQDVCFRGAAKHQRGQVCLNIFSCKYLYVNVASLDIVSTGIHNDFFPGNFSMDVVLYV